jgi:hypothetical protein
MPGQAWHDNGTTKCEKGFRVEKSLALWTTCCALLFASCTPNKIQTGTLLTRPSPTPEIIEGREVDTRSDWRLGPDFGKQYEQAGRPSFAIVGGFYQLPESVPYGAIQFDEAYGFGTGMRSIRVESIPGRPYALIPASPEQTDAISTVMQKFLDGGVKFSQISMSDAVTIMNAEKKALKEPGTRHLAIPFSQLLPTQVDFLVSVQKGYGVEGPVVVGRSVRTKDGRLFAVRSQVDFGPYALEPLIYDLVNDTVMRLAKENAREKRK